MPECVVPPLPRFVVDDETWRADVERIDLAPGLRLYLNDILVRRPVRAAPMQRPAGEFVVGQVALEGRLDLVFEPDAIARTTRDTALFYRVPDRSPLHAFEAGQRFRSAGYAIPIDRLERLLGDTLPEAVRPLLDAARGEEPRIVSVRNRRAMQDVARRLFACDLEGPLRRLMMEGAVLQLLALQASAAGAVTPRRGLGLSARERAATYEARERLVSDMRNPPSLAALAAAVGLSEKRLNAGFRELFNTTVFEVLRDVRLEHARKALGEGVSLKVIAHRVGYGHVSNFIHAYRTRFGAPPRASMKRAAK